MHKIENKRVKYRFFQITPHGWRLVKEYASLEEFLDGRNKRWIGHYMSPYFRSYPEYVLEDIEGNKYSADYLANFVPDEKWHYYGLSGSKRTKRHYRRIQVGSERRQMNDFDDEEYKLKVRSKRSNRLSFDPWGDDLLHDGKSRSREGNRNWKEYRKHQWKDTK
jgi:hypothetical protein